MNDHQPSTLLTKYWADRIRLIAIETMKGAVRIRRRPSTFCDKNISVGANGLADLKKDSVHVPVLSRGGFLRFS